MAAVATPSASGVLALLEDSDNEIVSYALHQLASLVDVFWADVADSASRLEILYEDAAFADRQLAALVAARLYYHLGDLDDALTFALGAGDLFEVTSDDQFVQTIICALSHGHVPVCERSATANARCEVALPVS